MKHIHILATGGTIAGIAAESTQLEGYQAASLGIEELLRSIPTLEQAAQVTSEQLFQIPSEDMEPALWLKLAHRLNELLECPDIDGVVVTHGTDTLEETSYFLQLTVKSSKPVVLVGAMRPASALSADGPLNLYHAVLAAAADSSRGKGVLVVMDDIILSGRDAQKTSTYRSGTFRGTEYGTLGTIQGGQVRYSYIPLKKHTAQSIFDTKSIKNLPSVPILYMYANSDTSLLRMVLDHGAAGVVLACLGNGTLHKNFHACLREYADKNILPPIVRASRVSSGGVAQEAPTTQEYDGDCPAAAKISAKKTDNPDNSDSPDKAKISIPDTSLTISAGDLNPQKARVLLLLGLAHGMNKAELSTAFTEY